MKRYQHLLDVNKLVQIFLPIFAMIGWYFTSMKLPQYGLLFAFVAQTLWLYVTYKAWKKANQIGGFITTILEISIITFGVVNYWML